MTDNLRRTLLACGLLLLAVSGVRADNEPPQDLATFPQSRLTIVTRSGALDFQIWTAETNSQRMQGLMYVRDLAADRGMLFVEERPRVAGMWMKNTYIPLDLLFMDARGKIVRILPMTKPLSLNVLSSQVPVKAVLELRGGEAARRNIRVGDIVQHAAFVAKKRR